MVDSIKGQSRAALSVQREAKGNALREGFKNLSSGTSVSQVSRDAAAVVGVEKRGEARQVGRIVSNLNDAVKFSEEALKALEGVQDSAKSLGGKSVVQDFAEDLSKLKSEIVDLLEGLRSRVETADVLSENIEAAELQVGDLEKAQARARSASSVIQFNSDEALSAHGGVSLDSVARLLAE